MSSFASNDMEVSYSATSILGQGRLGRDILSTTVTGLLTLSTFSHVSYHLMVVFGRLDYD